jgi:YVTN family beta-propeller protein
VAVLDAATLEVIADIPVGPPTNAPAVAVTPDGKKVYVANYAANTVPAIDTATNAVAAIIPVGVDPIAFGSFIQPAPSFAGTPGKANCYGRSVSALVRQYHGLHAAAAALEFSASGVATRALNHQRRLP